MMKKYLAKPTDPAAATTTATLAQQAMKPPDLPNGEETGIVDRIKDNDKAAKKRMGRVSTLAGGAYGKPATVKTIATSGL